MIALENGNGVTITVSSEDGKNKYTIKKPVTKEQKLPEGFQRAEFLLEKGAVDMIVDRREMRDKLARLLSLLQGLPPEQTN